MGSKQIKKFYIQWHVTDKCNLSCKHCYVDNKKKELPLEEMKRGIDNILLPVSNWVDEIEICFSGGEPFLYPFLEEIIVYLKKWDKVKKIMFTSNGTVIDYEKLKAIRDYVDNIQISLEGGKFINDKIRGQGVYEKVKKNIPIYKSLGWEISVNMTIHKLNYMEVHKAVDFCTENKVDVFAISRFVPGMSNDSDRRMMLSKKETESVYRDLFLISSQNKSLKFSFNRTLWCIIDQKVGASCSVGLNAISILPDGTILPCRRLYIPIGNFIKDNFVDIWTQSLVLNKLRDRKKIQKCKSCKYIDKCGGCRAIAYSASGGDFLSEDPQCFC